MPKATDEDSRRRGLEAGLRWSWTTIRQVEKLHTIEDRLKAGLRQGTRGSYSYEQRLPYWELNTETHLCLVAARNLVWAIDYLDPPGVVDFPHVPGEVTRHLIILRDCFEHWNERDGALEKTGSAGRAYRQFAQLQVGEAADTYRFDPTDTTIGGLSLSVLETVCRDVHAYLRGLEAGSFVWRGWDSVAGESGHG